ncbi:MAG: PAS domain-containing protein, partial [Lachnospiraceae bacterium]|nr:PAS domain-containing protein [Lachnospiraceae bacterium]
MGEKDSDFLLPLGEDSLPFLSAIVEGMPGGFLVYRADGNEEILHINKAVLRIFGCDTIREFRELTGYTFPGMVHPDDIEEVEKSIREQIAGSIYDLDYVEYRIRQKDGTTRWIEDYGHFVRSPIYGDIFYVFLEDATERMKRRMSQLEEINRELMNAYTMEKQYRKAILYDALYFFEVNLSADKFITPITQTVAEEGFGLFHNELLTGDMPFSSFVDICADQKAPDE